MKLYGLIGKTLIYSFSKEYFTKKFEAESIKDSEYGLFELDHIYQFSALISTHTFSGLNVTIPYKESVIPFLDELDEYAREIGAVNTISFDGSQLKGYNTDIIGFEESILKLIGDQDIEFALVLGTGGASKAIQFVLHKLCIKPTIASRTSGDIAYSEINKELLEKHKLIINCTPLGTYPDVDKCPDIPYKYLSEKHLLFDLVYNPEKTLFLKHGEEAGCKIMNGLPMLKGQAEAAWKIWNNSNI